MHLVDGEAFRIKGFQVYRKDRDSQVAWGEVAILIRKYVNHNLIPEINFKSFEVIDI